MMSGPCLQRVPAVFLDRDGTINVEKEYLFRTEDFEFIDGAPAAIGRLNAAGLKVIVVSNQSGVARGYYDLADVNRLHDHIDRVLTKTGARIDAYYVCPHHPDHDRADCDCRKPETGLLRRAAEEHCLDLRHSWMVGDKLVDIQAGMSAGCHPILVETGHGGKFVRVAESLQVPVAKSLVEAIEMLLNPGEKS